MALGCRSDSRLVGLEILHEIGPVPLNVVRARGDDAVVDDQNRPPTAFADQLHDFREVFLEGRQTAAVGNP